MTSTRTKRGGGEGGKEGRKEQEKKCEEKWLAFGGQGDLPLFGARHNRCGRANCASHLLLTAGVRLQFA
jgi:hypothetical protein